jgi:hypothetical protein
VTGTYRWTRCADELDVGSGTQLSPCPASATTSGTPPDAATAATIRTPIAGSVDRVPRRGSQALAPDRVHRSMNGRPPMSTFRRGYRSVSPAERAAFGMLSAFATTIGVSRAINYVRERRRPAPRLRGWARRACHSLGQEQVRVHHYLPGIGLVLAAGGTAILTRGDGRGFWLSVPFGTGARPHPRRDRPPRKPRQPVRDSERFAIIQSAAGALVAAALAAHFHRRGAALLSEPTPERGGDSRATSAGSAEAPVR